MAVIIDINGNININQNQWQYQCGENNRSRSYCNNGISLASAYGVLLLHCYLFPYIVDTDIGLIF
jgi:hypothetical protein